MSTSSYRRVTGILFIVWAVLVNIPYTLLAANFGYPAILRHPAGHILMRFQEGGAGLIATWLAFAWVGLPLLFAIVMLQKLLEREDTRYLRAATVVGVIGAVAQMIGLLRWAFVVPALASTYTDPAASAAAKDAAVVAFQVVNQYGGVVLGEHIGQIFTIIWKVMISVAMLGSIHFKRWLAVFGIVSSVPYILGQTELLASVFPNFPVVPNAGPIGSLLWLFWMIALGISLLRSKA